jgi:hypothetical protein
MRRIRLGRVHPGRVRLRQAWVRRVGDARRVRVGLSQQVGTATALMIVSTLAAAITARCANFLVVSSPVRVGLMPSLPPGFSESETLRQSRGDSWRPGPRLGGVRVLFELFELRLGPWPVRAAGGVLRTRPRQQL